MVTKRFPHTGVISYAGSGTFNSIGTWAEGTLTTISIACDIQSKSGSHVVAPSGDVISTNYLIFCDPNSGFSSVSDGANLEFFNKNHLIIQLFEYQHHVEIIC